MLFNAFEENSVSEFAGKKKRNRLKSVCLMMKQA
jgi:hypothetical protein